MSEPLLLRDGWVFDGKGFRGRQDVLLRGGRVAAIGPALVAPAEVVDCAGATVLPGLVDAHVHLAWAGLDAPATDVEAGVRRAGGNARRLLAAGVTTARDVGGPLEVLTQLGHAPSPDVLHAGNLLCAPGGHGTEIDLDLAIARECRGPEEFAAAVREQLGAGASFVKVALNGADDRVQMTREELLAVTEEAHRRGARVACHASVRDAVALAVACGVDTIEHGNGLDDELAEAMSEKSIVLVPTVSVFEELVDKAASDELLDEEQRRAHSCAARRRVTAHGPALAAARRAGVTIALGTDRVPGSEVVAVLEELRALERHGLTRAESLRAATSGGAAALGLGDRGTLQGGSRADVLVVPGDLARDLDGLTMTTRVIQAGRTVSTSSNKP